MSIPFQRSADSNGSDFVFQLDTITIGLRTIEESCPSDSSTAVITLVIFHTYMVYTYTYIHANSLQNVLSVCSTLHSPAPTTDTALTLMLYSVPASSPVRTVDVAGGEPERGAALLQDVVPLLLYCTSYREMFTSVWGVVQVTLRADVSDSTVLATKTPLTLEGTVRARDIKVKLSFIATYMHMKYVHVPCRDRGVATAEQVDRTEYQNYYRNNGKCTMYIITVDDAYIKAHYQKFSLSALHSTLQLRRQTLLSL